MEYVPQCAAIYDHLKISVPESGTLGACDVVILRTAARLAHALAGERLLLIPANH